MNQERINLEIENGTYYRKARDWYSELFHRPISDRSFYILVILLAVIDMYLAIDSFSAIFPISPPTFFTTYSDDVFVDLPIIKKLSDSEKEDKNTAVMQFFIVNYLKSREEYDLPKYEFRYRNIWSNSDKRVFDEYKTQIDANNVASPYHRYSNNAKKIVKEITLLNHSKNKDLSHATVIFRTSVISLANEKEIANVKMQVEMDYKYSDFEVDQSLDTSNPIAILFGLTGNRIKGSDEKRKVKPMSFTVYDYKAKELLE